MNRLRLAVALTVASLLATLLSTGATPSFAQPPKPTTAPAGPTTGPSAPAATPVRPTVAALQDSETVISFERLGVSEQVLRTPNNSTRVIVALPATWELTGTAKVQLDLTAFLNSETIQADGRSIPAPSVSVEVSFNDVTLDATTISTSGDLELDIPIAAQALTPSRGDGRHELRITLNDNSGDCIGTFSRASLVVRTGSQLVLPHRVVDPPTTLAALPRPIYQASFVPDSALLVVPKQPSAGEIQAALAVASGLGRMTDGRLELSLATVDRLSAVQRQSNHLIVIGKPAGLPLLDDLALPAAVKDAGFALPQAAPDNGVVQMVVSPWSPAKVVLVVSGNSDAAVIKAAQAVSVGPVRPSAKPNLAIVADVEPTAGFGAVSVDQTLDDLGYPLRVITREGGNAEYRFNIPLGQTVGEGAYVDLAFNHSALVDYDLSGMVVTLNGAPVGSARFSDATTRISTARFPLPASAVREGSNQLLVRANLSPRPGCYDPQDLELWLTIWPESGLHLPLAPRLERSARSFDLSAYPAPYALSPQLSRTGFVVAKNDPVGWNVATQIAFNLGDRANPVMSDLSAAFGDAVPADVRQNRDLILVGKASALPLVGELGDAMPAPFESGSNIARERDTMVVYSVPPGTSVGYIQLATPPWNADRTVLAVLGSDDKGLQAAGNALTSPRLRGRLAGNIAAISGEQVFTGETRRAPTPMPAPTATPAPTASPVGAGAAPVPTPAGTVAATNSSTLAALPYVIAVVVLLVVVAAVVWRQREVR